MKSATEVAGFVFNDGGRAAAGYKGHTGDCVCRSIAIATGLPYQQVYDRLNELGARERKGSKKRGTSNARTGIYKPAIRKIMAELGWTWVPTMQIGKGCTVHLDASELPGGTIIVSVSRHLTAMIDGVIHDTHDPRREFVEFSQDDGRDLKPNQFRNVNGIGTRIRRCVYGYFTAEAVQS